MASNNTHSTRRGGPEQTRKQMSDRVRRGVAVVSGAVEGFATELEEGDLPGNTEKAVTLAGQTVRRLAETGAIELGKTRSRVRQPARGLSAGRTASRGGRPLRARAKQAARRLKQTVEREAPRLKRTVAAKKATIQRKARATKGRIERTMGH